LSARTERQRGDAFIRTSFLLPSVVNLLDLKEIKEGGLVFGCSLVIARFAKKFEERFGCDCLTYTIAAAARSAGDSAEDESWASILTTISSGRSSNEILLVA
jgi:hypothetical protein